MSSSGIAKARKQPSRGRWKHRGGESASPPSECTAHPHGRGLSALRFGRFRLSLCTQRDVKGGGASNEMRWEGGRLVEAQRLEVRGPVPYMG